MIRLNLSRYMISSEWDGEYTIIKVYDASNNLMGTEGNILLGIKKYKGMIIFGSDKHTKNMITGIIRENKIKKILE